MSHNLSLFLEGGGAHWAPKSDFKWKIKINICDVGLNFLVSDGIQYEGSGGPKIIGALFIE